MKVEMWVAMDAEGYKDRRQVWAFTGRPELNSDGRFKGTGSVEALDEITHSETFKPLLKALDLSPGECRKITISWEVE